MTQMFYIAKILEATSIGVKGVLDPIQLPSLTSLDICSPIYVHHAKSYPVGFYRLLQSGSKRVNEKGL